MTKSAELQELRSSARKESACLVWRSYWLSESKQSKRRNNSKHSTCGNPRSLCLSVVITIGVEFKHSLCLCSRKTDSNSGFHPAVVGFCRSEAWADLVPGSPEEIILYSVNFHHSADFFAEWDPLYGMKFDPHWTKLVNWRVEFCPVSVEFSPVSVEFSPTGWVSSAANFFLSRSNFRREYIRLFLKMKR